jgi:hypothetical protein
MPADLVFKAAAGRPLNQDRRGRSFPDYDRHERFMQYTRSPAYHYEND